MNQNSFIIALSAALGFFSYPVYNYFADAVKRVLYYHNLKKQPIYEVRTFDVAEAEAFLLRNKDWEYVGYGAGDTMHVRKPLDKQGT